MSCGEQIEPEQKFCSHCGKAIAWEPVIITPSLTTAASTLSQSQPASPPSEQPQMISATSNIATSNFCQNCGRKIQPNSQFCDGCGKPLEALPTGSPTIGNEFLLGGLKTGSLKLIGKAGGYGIYATNKRLIGVAYSSVAVAPLFGLIGAAAYSHHDHSLKSIQELDAEKDLEIRKEQIQQIRMKKTTGLSSGYMNVFLYSGANAKLVIGTKDTYDDVRRLMEAFYPQVIVDDS